MGHGETLKGDFLSWSEDLRKAISCLEGIKGALERKECERRAFIAFVRGESALGVLCLGCDRLPWV